MYMPPLRPFPSSFFFYHYYDHRDLHSFPTRRSSDLRRRGSTGCGWSAAAAAAAAATAPAERRRCACTHASAGGRADRKSTRLNSSHVAISYAVFCLKKKKKNERKISIEESADIESDC